MQTVIAAINMDTNNLELCVEPYKFLYDYKIIVFYVIIFIFALILFLKKYKRQSICVFISNTIIILLYLIKRKIEIKKYGYFYFISSNTDFSELYTYVVEFVILYIILLITFKAFKKLKGGKNNGSNI